MITIDSIVRESIGATGQSTMHEYQVRLKHALDVWLDLNLDSTPNTPLTVKIPLDGIRRAKLPDDYVDYISVGINLGNKIKNLSINPDMWPFMDKDKCGDLIPWDDSCPIDYLPIEQTSTFYYTNFINDYGENKGGFYGVGGGYNKHGYFNIINYTNGEKYIEFDTRVKAKEIYLMYISTGFNCKQLTLVPETCKKVIETGIHYKMAVFKYGAASKEAMAWRMLYEEALPQAWARMDNLTIWDIVNIFRRNEGQSVRD